MKYDSGYSTNERINKRIIFINMVEFDWAFSSHV